MHLEDAPPLDELVPVEIELENDITFKIFHNLNGMLDAAVMNWLARTTDYTAESFSSYVKSKRDKGYIDQWVLTEHEYTQALIDHQTKQQ